ncbi:MAG TPA: hypothetical protein VFT98_18220 [Myxococcota bacterium]|nr:hypothetical protein [Myxococcota bacterium]
MDRPDVPQQALAFIAENIDSVPQLEALLLFWESPTRSWSCDELAARLYVRPDACQGILHALRRRGLLAVEDRDGERYRYDSAWDPDGERMAQVASAYREHLVALTTFIHTKTPPALREFARAFDLKKER